MVLFSPDFEYKVDSFNLYIITVRLKGLLGGVYRELKNFLWRAINKVHLPYLFLLFYNLITDRGYLPTKIKSIEFPLLSLFIWNNKASKDRGIV